MHKFQSDIKKLRRASEASLTRSRSPARTENIEKEVMAERVAHDLVRTESLRSCRKEAAGRLSRWALPEQGAHDWSKRSQGTIETGGRRQYTGTHA
ncbi:hypothetical protein CN187_26175 [Sinorhizobium meliloti]|nr:hypothetical protein CN187_26175 [Sinorhizobium meliloti]